MLATECGWELGRTLLHGEYVSLVWPQTGALVFDCLCRHPPCRKPLSELFPTALGASEPDSAAAAFPDSDPEDRGFSV